MLSIIFNSVIVISVCGAVAALVKYNPVRAVLRYFTVLSNILCASGALLMVISRLNGTVPQAVLYLKYSGTCAVAVTLLTVLFFLGPVMGYKMLLTGPDFWLHLFCPVLSIVSLLFRDKVAMGFPFVFLGVLPVALYAVLYVYKVLILPEEEGWEDFYGFNRGGRWPVSLAAMLAGSFLVSWVLWMLM